MIPSSAPSLPRIAPARAAGFTLIEVMAVVVIMAILAAIAYPSYQAYIIRANRSAAQQFMLSIASREEQYVIDARAYTATIGAGGLNLTQPAETTARYTFAVTVSAGPPPGYTISATPIGPQASDGPADLTLDNLGVKTPADKWKK